MGKLHPDQRKIILLVALEGMSYEAVAKLFDIPIGTVRSRLSRGRAALRQLMDTGFNEREAAGVSHDQRMSVPSIEGTGGLARPPRDEKRIMATRTQKMHTPLEEAMFRRQSYLSHELSVSPD